MSNKVIPAKQALSEIADAIADRFKKLDVERPELNAFERALIRWAKDRGKGETIKITAPKRFKTDD